MTFDEASSKFYTITELRKNIEKLLKNKNRDGAREIIFAHSSDEGDTEAVLTKPRKTYEASLTNDTLLEELNTLEKDLEKRKNVAIFRLTHEKSTCDMTTGYIEKLSSTEVSDMQ